MCYIINKGFEKIFILWKLFVFMEKYDVVIIGAGPAGLTAGIYSGRSGLKTLIVGSLVGGMAGEASEIANFPSYEKVKGYELVAKMINQVKKIGVEVKSEQVLEIKKEKDFFDIYTRKGNYLAKKIIIATGSERKKLGLKQEKEFAGKGLHYCAVCDSGFYKDKVTAVVGGGNAALTASLLLANISKKVYIIHRGESFPKAEKSWSDEVKKNKKIEIYFNSVLNDLIGKNKLEKIEIEEKGKSKKINVDGLFIEIGSVPISNLAQKIGVKLEKDYIIVDKNQKTNVNGIFAAGDITNNPLKQIVTACGEGAVAAYSAYQELMNEKK